MIWTLSLSGKNPATENPPVLQVVNRGINLIQRVSMRDEVVQLEPPFAVPPNEHRKIPLGRKRGHLVRPRLSIARYAWIVP